MLRGFFAPRPRESVADWCCRCLVFDEPQNNGPFNLIGTEYMRDQLDARANPTLQRLVAVQGTQTRKTGGIMGGSAWKLIHTPTRLFWVMPTQADVMSFSKTRWMKMLRATPVFAPLIPSGARRHDFKTLQQMVGSSIVDFKWSNSPSALASIPAPDVILDEVDKFDMGGGKEANSVELAEQRTKSFANPQIVMSSTPTLLDGLIWQELLKTDFRRRFLPCPHCAKHIVLAWSKYFTTMKLLGCEAFVRWDKEARHADGSWDLDRVEKSARFECPHCAGHILDAHKTKMDRLGEWRATQTTSRDTRGWHLPSLYSPSASRNVGKLAVMFLKNKRSLTGLQGFVNNELAEPWSNQNAGGERIELITGPDAKPIEGAIKLLIVDVQRVSPYFWWEVSEVSGDQRLVDYGTFDDWEEIRKKQLEHGIEDNHVGIDSGDDTDEVYKQCLRYGKLVPLGPGVLPIWRGWTPLKGVDEKRRDNWKDKAGNPRPFHLGSASLTHRKFRLPLLEFSGHYLKGVLSRLRQGKTEFRWEVCARAAEDPEYWKHLDSEFLKPFHNPRTNRTEYIWVKRSKQWPNHLLDCAVMRTAMALFHKKLPFEPANAKTVKPDREEQPPEEQSHAE
jgi:hypothetical protein